MAPSDANPFEAPKPEPEQPDFYDPSDKPWLRDDGKKSIIGPKTGAVLLLAAWVGASAALFYLFGPRLGSFVAIILLAVVRLLR